MNLERSTEDEIIQQLKDNQDNFKISKDKKIKNLIDTNLNS